MYKSCAHRSNTWLSAGRSQSLFQLFTFIPLSIDLTIALEEKGDWKKDMDIPRDTTIERFLCLLTS